MVDTPESLFDDRLNGDAGRPLVTFYDDATGERAELSTRSLGNWVAKTHFLLLDELGLGPGDPAYVALDVHWLAAPVLFGCWFAGLEVVSDPTQAVVAFGEAGRLAHADLSAVEDVYAVSLLSMARSDTPPDGMTDYAAAVRPQPDAWAGVRPQAGPETPALDGLSRAELVATARTAAAGSQTGPGDRVLWARPWLSTADWIAGLLAPIAVGASTVLVRNADPGTLNRRAESERAVIIS